MLNKLYEAIEEVLESIDVGGEQSRQFAEEIKIKTINIFFIHFIAFQEVTNFVCKFR